jgi:hypothetical protein
MFHVYFTNFRYGVDGFQNIEDALKFIQDQGFMAGIYDQSFNLLLSWDPITGTTDWRK